MRISKIGQFAVYLLMSALGLVSSAIPLAIRGRIGIGLGYMMYIFGRRRQRIAMQNLQIAFPDYSLSKRKKIMIESFKNLGITFLEVAALNYLNKDNIKSILDLKNYDIINQATEKGNGVIMLSGHYGNWEYIAAAAGIYSGVPITIVVKKQKNSYIDKDVNDARTKFGNKVVPMTNAARALIQAIRSNEAVALLVDQSAKFGKDSLVEFFGKNAITFDAPAEIALKFNTPIVYAFARRNPDFTYTAELRELDFSDLQYSKENVLELTKRHVKVLEEQIRKYPEFWAWQHRRWKHTVEYD